MRSTDFGVRKGKRTRADVSEDSSSFLVSSLSVELPFLFFLTTTFSFFPSSPNSRTGLSAQSADLNRLPPRKVLGLTSIEGKTDPIRLDKTCFSSSTRPVFSRSRLKKCFQHNRKGKSTPFGESHPTCRQSTNSTLSSIFPLYPPSSQPATCSEAS